MLRSLKPAQGSLEIMLHTAHKGSLTEESPVYYRGMEVGVVRYFELNQDASGVIVHVLIEKRFAALVRTNTKNLNAGGINVSLKIVRDQHERRVRESPLVIGGVEFATPDAARTSVPAVHQHLFSTKSQTKNGSKAPVPYVILQTTNTSEHATPPSVPEGIQALTK